MLPVIQFAFLTPGGNRPPAYGKAGPWDTELKHHLNKKSRPEPGNG
ncbi:hypothetical protein B4098_1388 [Heyndrickxia coagulans]|uniref:Uncharacterized protein n=1 Tax=Heyndrickxia coagulans TaxID=1398 RepID=A0A150JY62_HEYCO|nr:hypothetical protein B4098_1388 [Heyndrickxia coagulans]